MTIRVDGEEIPEEAVLYELGRLVQFYSQHMPESEIRNQMPQLRRRAEQQALGARLLLDEVERLDIQVSLDEVENGLQEMVKRAGGREKFDEMLNQQNLTEESVKASIRRGKRVDKLVETITSGISDPAEDEMEQHFREHAEEYRQPEKAQARHILIKSDSDSPQDKEEARMRISEIRERILGGEDFGDMAAMYSDCPSGGKSGGSLGWISRGMMAPEFDEAVFAMETGEISDIIETSFGYHIVNKTGEEDGEAADYDQVREDIRDFLRHVKKGNAISAHVEELKKKVEIEES